MSGTFSRAEALRPGPHYPNHLSTMNTMEAMSHRDRLPRTWVFRTTEQQRRSIKEQRLTSLGQCYPEKTGSLGSTYICGSQWKRPVHWLGGMADDRRHLLTRDPSVSSSLEHFPCPAPSPKPVLPIHMSVKIANLLPKVFLTAPPFPLPNTLYFLIITLP